MKFRELKINEDMMDDDELDQVAVIAHSPQMGPPKSLLSRNNGGEGD